MASIPIAPAAVRRGELGTFLRSRRARITPDEVGLPRTGRRRTPGLRREELAFLAGISATWYTYLEQDRDVRPSAQVLSALAVALRLTDAEREHLFSLAGSSGPEAVDAGELLVAHVAPVPLLLQPNPAYITGAGYDVLAWNPAAAELFTSLTTPAGPEGVRPNLARWMFTDPASKQVLLDWEDVARDLLARLRTAAVRHRGDPRFTRLVEDLHAASPQVRAWWPRYDIRSSHSGTKRLRHPRRGKLTLTHASFAVADAPEQTLVVYYDDAASSPDT